MSGSPGLSANARNKSFRAMRLKFAIEILPFVHGTIWRRRAILVLLIISIDRYKTISLDQNASQEAGALQRVRVHLARGPRSRPASHFGSRWQTSGQAGAIMPRIGMGP